MPRMGAFAGWLHHPAHAPSYHDSDHFSIHRCIARRRRQSGQRFGSPLLHPAARKKSRQPLSLSPHPC
ncbi:hypothetical protein C1M53_24115 [Mesorhizobium sp. Pch-S]|nr:hypothetical protein C1M53_24115 [Mesorhizobium sp. Pch-S]